jgi:dTMP kinase
VRTLPALRTDRPSPLPWLEEISRAGPAETAVQSWIAGYFALVALHNATTVVTPTLAAGRWVCCDRWTLDHHANQEALGVPMTPWFALLQAAPRPDLHLLVDVPPAVAQQRIDQRGGKSIGSGTEFLIRCRAIMLALAGSPDYGPVEIIDGTQSPERVLQDALEALDRCLGDRGGRPR